MNFWKKFGGCGWGRFAVPAIAGISLLSVGCSHSTANTASDAPVPMVPFTTVQPIITQRCVGCHNGPSGRGGVDLSSYAAIMKAGPPDQLVKPGDPAGSLLIQAIHGKNVKLMPPRNGPIPADEITKLEAWVKSGAKQS